MFGLALSSLLLSSGEPVLFWVTKGHLGMLPPLSLTFSLELLFHPGLFLTAPWASSHISFHVWSHISISRELFLISLFISLHQEMPTTCYVLPCRVLHPKPLAFRIVTTESFNSIKNGQAFTHSSFQGSKNCHFQQSPGKALIPQQEKAAG